MLPDRLSNPEPLTYESGALPIALRGPVSFRNKKIAISLNYPQYPLLTGAMWMPLLFKFICFIYLLIHLFYLSVVGFNLYMLWISELKKGYSNTYLFSYIFPTV